MKTKQLIIIAFVVMISTAFSYNQLIAKAQKQDDHQEEQEVEESKIEEEKYERSDLRAFYTAPPVIPHKVDDQRGMKECLYCHQEVLQIGERTSIKAPHPQFYNCQQCHVQGNLTNPIVVNNSWKGLKEPRRGTIAHEYAPTTIPHRLYLRENCLSCHGPNHPEVEMRTPHPERVNCLQCHVPMKGVRFNVQ